MMFEYVKI